MTSKEIQIRDEALEVLREILHWEMDAVRWERLTEILDVAVESELSGDLDAFAHAVVQLELAGPVRITRISGTSPQPPPPPVRERINTLVHRLSGGRRGHEEALPRRAR
jgi:hypothetical protein